jgi:predicted transport protein
VIPQKQRLRLILNIDPARLAAHPLARDVSGVGHWGVGNTEVTLDSEDSLAEVLHWIGEAAKEAIPG